MIEGFKSLHDEKWFEIISRINRKTEIHTYLEIQGVFLHLAGVEDIHSCIRSEIRSEIAN